MTRSPVKTLGLALALATTSLAAGPDEVAYAPDQVRPLLIGADVPSVSVRTRSGKTVNLRTLSAEKKTIFLFFRGGW